MQTAWVSWYIAVVWTHLHIRVWHAVYVQDCTVVLACSSYVRVSLYSCCVSINQHRLPAHCSMLLQTHKWLVTLYEPLHTCEWALNPNPYNTTWYTWTRKNNCFGHPCPFSSSWVTLDFHIATWKVPYLSLQTVFQCTQLLNEAVGSFYGRWA